MGQQQLLIIILGIIIVVIGIAVGIGMLDSVSAEKVSSSLVQVELMEVATTAPSTYNSEVKLWATTATLEGGQVVQVLSDEEMPTENIFTVRKMVMQHRSDQYIMYWYR
ncbi:TPA: hypothetical protein DIC39_02855 [Patescibacteria group bacterium]|nr:hypothetical protein [Patescibacteria group bacterium]HCU47971.1 hypothetical protein [Patescibacteria group bacterium]